jgi:hypothetical protein
VKAKVDGTEAHLFPVQRWYRRLSSRRTGCNCTTPENGPWGNFCSEHCQKEAGHAEPHCTSRARRLQVRFVGPFVVARTPPVEKSHDLALVITSMRE